MGTPLDLLNAFKEIDVILVAQDSINENAALMIRLNNEQLDQGLKASGIEFPDYSDASVNSFGKPKSPFTLKDTGKLRQGLYYKAVDDMVYYGSNGETAEDAESNENIGQMGYGITQENKERFLQPQLQITSVSLIKKYYGFE